MAQRAGGVCLALLLRVCPCCRESSNGEGSRSSFWADCVRRFLQFCLFSLRSLSSEMGVLLRSGEPPAATRLQTFTPHFPAPSSTAATCRSQPPTVCAHKDGSLVSYQAVQRCFCSVTSVDLLCSKGREKRTASVTVTLTFLWL